MNKAIEKEQKPVAWVTCGDIDHSPEDHPPNMHRLTTSYEEAEYWKNKCFLRVRPVFLGKPI